MSFQILSLSGGGYLGLYTAAVLAEIEEQTGRKMIDMFDLFAGTSIGGIIALGLAGGVAAAEIRDAFLDNGEQIFGRSSPPTGIRKYLGYLGSAKAARYSASPLRTTIVRILGAETKIKDLRRPIVVTAVNLTKGGPKVFKTGHHARLMLDWRLNAVDVALATSAAPTYFPVHAIGDELFADGGLFANSPDLIAVHEAEEFLDVASADLRLLSVGTTTTCFAFASNVPRSMGVADWVKDERLTSVIIGSQQAITHDMMRHRLGERYLRIDRIQADAQRGELALDCASEGAKAVLKAMARASFAEASGSDVLQSMLRHSAVDRPFVNASL